MTDEELRGNVDQAMIYAPDKWRAYVYRVAQAYAAAYSNQEITLSAIEAQQRVEAEFATFMLSFILPALAGGFMGAIFSGYGKELVDGFSDKSLKFMWGVAVDTGKTVVSDTVKGPVRLAYQRLVENSKWKPTSIKPSEFMASALGPISEFMTAAADLMNNARTGKPGPTYREVLEALYYGPFIRDAPEEKDLWDVNQLAPVLEVFLWVDWANHADTQLWLARIMDVTEEHSTLDWDPNRDDSYRYAMFLRDADLLKDLNPILERLDHCGVNRAYITEGMPSLQGYRFLNILWLRHLARYYQGTLLGDLLGRRDAQSNVPVPIYRRPKSYRLM